MVSPTFYSYRELFKEVVIYLGNAELKINAKNSFYRLVLLCIGHVVDDGTIRTDPDKISVIALFPKSKSVKQVRWYVRLVPEVHTKRCCYSDLLTG